MDKKTIRQTMLEKRSLLEKKENLDELIYQHALSFAHDYQTIALFHSFEEEIDTHRLIETLLNQGKRVACPKIKDKVMQFYEVRSLGDFELGFYDIYEPKGDTIISQDEFDLCFVPLLAYNDDFYRVGYGGGYYDRYLKDVNAKKIGLAYSFQALDLPFQQEYDVQLDGIINELGICKSIT